MSYSTIYFNQIHVVESLRPADTRTGRNLYDGFLQHVPFRFDGMTTGYHWVDTARELETVLRQLEAEAEAGHSPILHLECHGGRQGIELASGEKMR